MHCKIEFMKQVLPMFLSPGGGPDLPEDIKLEEAVEVLILDELLSFA